MMQVNDSGNCRHSRGDMKRGAVQLRFSLVSHHIGGRESEYKEACQSCLETAGIKIKEVAMTSIGASG